MEITVDPDLCESNGRCVRVAPQVFGLDDDDVLRVTPPAPDVDPALVVRAVASCPRAALSLTGNP